MVKCPTCLEEKGESKDFEAKGDMRNHHYMAHGERLPNRTCKKCGEKFHDSKSTKVYCDDCPRESAKEKTDCIECGKEFKYYPSEKKGLYCEVCVDKTDWKSQNLPSNISGKNNPNWKGGSNDSTTYTGKWNSVRRKCLKRDNHTCQNCGKNKQELGREPDVHHIIPVKTFENEQDAHYIDNVICLCSSCHNKAEEGCIDDEKLLSKKQSL